VTAEPNGIYELRPGARWADGSFEYEVVGVSMRGDDVVYSVRKGDEYVTLTASELVAVRVESAWAMDPSLLEHADDNELLASLTASEYQEILREEADILEATTGYRTLFRGVLDKPAPQYDPALVPSKTQRMRTKAVERGVSLSTLYDRVKKWQEGGRAALVNGNRKAYSDPLANMDPELVKLAKECVISEGMRTSKSKINKKVILNSWLRKHGYGEGLNDYKLGLLITELSRGQSFFGDATTRRSKQLRPTRAGGSWETVETYGEVMQLDPTPCDFFAWSPGAQAFVNVWAIVLTDLCTRITSVLLTLAPPSARSVAMALIRRMMPPEMISMARPWILAPTIPRTLLYSPPGIPAAVPGELHLDHGREGENGDILELTARVGTDVVFCQPRSPAQKAHVERVIGKLSERVGLFPGHKGNAVKNRSESPESDVLLTVDVQQHLVDEICYQDMFIPHAGLRHPMVPGRFLMPFEKYNISLLRGAPLRICPDVNLLLRALPTVRAAVNGGAAAVDNLIYTCDEIATLEALSAGDRQTPSVPLTFHWDPYDRSRLFWHERGTGRIITLRAKGSNGEALPPFSEYTYAQLLKLAGSKRLNKTQVIDLRTEFYDYVQALAKTKSGQAELAREFARWCEAVPEADPEVRESEANAESWTAEPRPNDALPIWEDDGVDEDDMERLAVLDEEFEANWS